MLSSPAVQTDDAPGEPEPMEAEEETMLPAKRDVSDVAPPFPDTAAKRLRFDGHFMGTKEFQTLHTLHWMIDRKKQIRLHLQDLWAETMKVPKWFMSITKEMILQTSKSKHSDLQSRCSYLVHVPSMRERDYRIDLAHGGSFVCMTAEDNISEDAVADIWPLVDEADGKEISQFVQEKAFEKMRLKDVPRDTVIIDGTWVRRRKMKLGKRIVKSRMCARGCFDPQKDILATRSTTASRLSQRILMSAAAIMHVDPNSWDVSGAFLKGLTFDRIREILLSQGIKTLVRAVVLIPPYNVWRHLAAADASFSVPPEQIPEFGLWCLKPIYGLNDAPVAWQLSLGEFLRKRSGRASHLDDSFYFWKSNN